MPTSVRRWWQAVFPTGLRARLMWSFVLMSCVPIGILLLIAGWFVFPYTKELFPFLGRFFLDPGTEPGGTTVWMWAVLSLTILVSILGSLYLTIKIVEPVLRVSREATRVAEDPTSGVVEGSQDAELGDLTQALQSLSGRIRQDMAELESYGARTTQLNQEINKRMVMLSGLLQISDLIGGGADLEAILDLVVDRLGSIEHESFSFLCLQPNDGLAVAARRAHRIDAKRLSQIVFDRSSVIIDADHPAGETIAPLWEQLGKPNLIIQPIVLRAHVVGILGFGNRRGHESFPPELIDLVSVFVKQAGIALESALLLRNTKALAIKDEVTELYNERYIKQRLDEEIGRAVAYQRPCAVVVFRVDGFEAYQARHGTSGAERAIRKVAKVMEQGLADVDRAGRLGSHEFLLVLPERSKMEAISLAEEIRRHVEFAFSSCEHTADRLTVSGGVAENPVDGVTAQELLGKSGSMLAGAEARSHGNTVLA